VARTELAALAERVVKKASERGLKLATAESCTAGSLATLLADAPGASAQFHGGFVAYSKEQKAAVLGVPSELIAAHTAVSQQVAEAMATGVLERCPADVGIAITGVAGPEPDEDGNPVGLMHVTVACRGEGIRHRKLLLGIRDRESVRDEAIKSALTLVHDVLDAASRLARAPSHPASVASNPSP
jgi:nicotinamide-nucleotide amidase